jgi:hypothetical protein
MILTKDLRKELVKKLDDIIKLPWWAEPFDSVILNFGFNYLDENYGDKIPDQYQEHVTSAVQCFVDDDFEGMKKIVPLVVDEIVDIPGLDDDFEGKFLAINIQAVFKFIEFYANKRA